MNKMDRFFTQLRRVAVVLWFKLWSREKYMLQYIVNLKNHRSTMLMLSTYAKIISITGNMCSPEKSAQDQNPIAQLDEQHRFPTPRFPPLRPV